MFIKEETQSCILSVKKYLFVKKFYFILSYFIFLFILNIWSVLMKKKDILIKYWPGFYQKSFSIFDWCLMFYFIYSFIYLIVFLKKGLLYI